MIIHCILRVIIPNLNPAKKKTRESTRIYFLPLKKKCKKYLRGLNRFYKMRH